MKELSCRKPGYFMICLVRFSWLALFSLNRLAKVYFFLKMPR